MTSIGHASTPQPSTPVSTSPHAATPQMSPPQAPAPAAAAAHAWEPHTPAPVASAPQIAPELVAAPQDPPLPPAIPSNQHQKVLVLLHLPFAHKPMWRETFQNPWQ